MKRILLAFFACLSFGILAAQTGDCEPNPMYADSSAGVYPKPYDPDVSPNGGITECGVIGQPYQFDFTVVIGDSLTLGPQVFPLDSVVVTGVQGLPVGISYACEPSNCHYLKNTIGCAAIFGTPTAANAPGDYDLTIEGVAYVSGFPLQITFPNPLLAPGKYTLQLLPDDVTPCTVVGAKEPLADKVSIAILPNPSAGLVQVQVISKIAGKFDLQVTDLLGRSAYHSTVDLSLGQNSLPFDGSYLSNGLYLLTLKNEKGYVSQKLAIQH